MGMTNVQISLPDSLAREASAAGLLTPQNLAALLREELAERKVADLVAARKKIVGIAPMTANEINEEIKLYRAEQQRAHRS